MKKRRFSYHNQIAKWIREGKLIGWAKKERHNAISPALCLFFDNGRMKPIREYRWEQYDFVIKNYPQIDNK